MTSGSVRDFRAGSSCQYVSQANQANQVLQEILWTPSLLSVGISCLVAHTSYLMLSLHTSLHVPSTTASTSLAALCWNFFAGISQTGFTALYRDSWHWGTQLIHLQLADHQNFRLFCAEMLLPAFRQLAAMPMFANPERWRTLHLSAEFHMAHSFSLLSICLIASLPSCILTVPLSAVIHTNSAKIHSIPLTNMSKSQFQNQFCGASQDAVYKTSYSSV